MRKLSAATALKLREHVKMLHELNREANSSFLKTSFAKDAGDEKEKHGDHDKEEQLLNVHSFPPMNTQSRIRSGSDDLVVAYPAKKKGSWKKSSFFKKGSRKKRAILVQGGGEVSIVSDISESTDGSEVEESEQADAKEDEEAKEDEKAKEDQEEKKEEEVDESYLTLSVIESDDDDISYVSETYVPTFDDSVASSDSKLSKLMEEDLQQKITSFNQEVAVALEQSKISVKACSMAFWESAFSMVFGCSPKPPSGNADDVASIKDVDEKYTNEDELSPSILHPPSISVEKSSSKPYNNEGSMYCVPALMHCCPGRPAETRQQSETTNKLEEKSGNKADGRRQESVEELSNKLYENEALIHCMPASLPNGPAEIRQESEPTDKLEEKSENKADSSTQESVEKLSNELYKNEDFMHYMPALMNCSSNGPAEATQESEQADKVEEKSGNKQESKQADQLEEQSKKKSDAQRQERDQWEEQSKNKADVQRHESKQASQLREESGNKAEAGRLISEEGVELENLSVDNTDSMTSCSLYQTDSMTSRTEATNKLKGLRGVLKRRQKPS